MKILDILKKHFPDARLILNYRNVFELLVVTILAAQAPDERVNQVSPALFQKYPNPAAMAEANDEEMDKIIQAISFYRQKGRHIRAMSKKIVQDFQGEVPKTVEELVQLNGVGRKTANIVLANGFGIPAIPVDTHIARVSQRLGLSEFSNPEQIELDLTRIFPQEKWIQVSHLLGFLGRYICQAKKPKCWECPVFDWCSYPTKNAQKGLKEVN
ncbi:MAG: endonuclease III [Candidatus Atribacteria bacterium]|nr:endonuclease III [Candidatus Atribacteria bacterium]